MNATTIKKELEMYTGAVTISKKELALAMGKKSVNSVSKYTDGLQKFGTRYFIRDVAEQIVRYGR